MRFDPDRPVPHFEKNIQQTHQIRVHFRFDLVRKLGQGTYGKVQLGINKETGQEVKVKRFLFK
jgi:serine/threonine protein kinase